MYARAVIVGAPAADVDSHWWHTLRVFENARERMGWDSGMLSEHKLSGITGWHLHSPAGCSSDFSSCLQLACPATSAGSRLQPAPALLKSRLQTPADSSLVQPGPASFSWSEGKRPAIVSILQPCLIHEALVYRAIFIVHAPVAPWCPRAPWGLDLMASDGLVPSCPSRDNRLPKL